MKTNIPRDDRLALARSRFDTSRKRTGEVCMNWFKNLNATPRLMSSFGVMIALALVIGFFGVRGLSSSNDRIAVLYNDDVKGLTIASDINVSRMESGRELRDAMLNIGDSAIVAADRKVAVADFTKIHSSLDGADKAFYAPEGAVLIAQIRTALPAYEKSTYDAFDRLNANDIAGAEQILDHVIEVTAKPLYDGAERAQALKEQRVAEKFEANTAAYQTARTLLLSACGICVLLGLLLSRILANTFSVPLALAVTALERVADGDLTVILEVNTRDEVGRMAGALNNAVQRLHQTMSAVSDNAVRTNSSAQELAAAAEAIASGSQEQAASLEETSASMEEITATVRQSADNAQQASQLANGSKESAQLGEDVVSSAVNAMTEINTASAKISDIISTIDEIAFQTNLLAVNAAVEAARAGDEGRGFAVVASEVRSLAQRSSVAAKEIKVLIQDSLRKVDAGSVLVNRSGETLRGIVGSVKRVTDIVGEMAVASAEQSSGIEQVNTAMTQMDHVTQSNSAQTEELSATAHVLSQQAAQLLELVGSFTLNVSTAGSIHGQSFGSREAAQPERSSPARYAQSGPSSNHVVRRPSKGGRSGVNLALTHRAVHKAELPAVLASASASASKASAASSESFQEF
jgi:methyl-accepting chemotaxis protein